MTTCAAGTKHARSTPAVAGHEENAALACESTRWSSATPGSGWAGAPAPTTGPKAAPAGALQAAARGVGGSCMAAGTWGDGWTEW